MKYIFTILILLSSIYFKSFAQVNYTESFDGTTFVPTGWTNLLVSGTNTWTRVTAGSFPTQTPHSGAGEAQFNSFSTNSGVRALVTPVINYSNRGVATTTVSFWMYRDNGYNTTADKIDVYMNTAANLTGANLLGTINRAIGLAPIVASNGWYQYSFSVPASYTTATNYFIIKATSAYGDNIFIDDVSWTAYPPPAIDMQAIGLISPTNLSCITLNQSVSVQIKNNGTVPINFSSNPVTITSTVSIVETGTGLSSTVTISPFTVATGSLAVGSSTNVVITNSLNTSINGNYTFNAKTSTAGDVLTSNDAMTASSVIVSKVNNLPFDADFGTTSTADFLTQQVSGTGLWTLVTTGNLSNPTLTPVLNSANGFAYFNSYSFSSGTVANLITPTFNFNSYANPVIDIWVSQDNGWAGYNDKLDLLVSTDGGTTWSTSLLTIQRYNTTYSTPGWKKFSLPLTLYAGQSCVRIAIKATSAFGNNIAIDYLKVYDAGSILPIKLVDFSGSQMSEMENLLTWKTAEEVNTKLFEIERSSDGVNFSKVHSQDAEGSQTGNSYVYIDTMEYEMPVVYYRLVSVDNDNTKEMFKIVSIERNYSQKFSVKLYPNPTNSNTTLQIRTNVKDNILLEVYDSMGKIVDSENLFLENEISTISINTENLSEGIYYVKVFSLSDNTCKTNQKIVKLK